MENHHEENPRVKRKRESIQNAFKELVLNGRSKDIIDRPGGTPRHRPGPAAPPAAFLP